MRGGTALCSNEDRRLERNGAPAQGEMDRAPSQNRKCEVIPIRDSASSPQINYQGPTGHEEAVVNVAEGLRVECGHGLVIIHSATAIQNLQLAVCNGKADLGAILVE